VDSRRRKPLHDGFRASTQRKVAGPSGSWIVTTSSRTSSSPASASRRRFESASWLEKNISTPSHSPVQSSLPRAPSEARKKPPRDRVVASLDDPCGLVAHPDRLSFPCFFA